MADPLTIIGTAASVGTIIDLLSKSICTIRELQAQWQDADLASLSLGSQMGVLRAALTKIQEWIETGPSDAHHQLIMDLDSSLLCCKTLVGKIDAHLSALQQKSDGSLDMASRIKLVLRSHDIEEIQKMIERQTNTLTLLLTACNCKTMSEQKILLLKSSTRKAISRVEKDSASLIVHRDAGSIRTSYTDNLSKLSAVFTFDGEIFTSRIYERAFRVSLKDLLRQRRDRPSRPTRVDEIDAARTPIKILLLGRIPKIRKTDHTAEGGTTGAGVASKSTLIKQMRILYDNGFSEEEREHWREKVFNNVLHAFRKHLDLIEEQGIPIEEVSHGVCITATEVIVDLAKPLFQFFWRDPVDLDNPQMGEYLRVYKTLLKDKGLQLSMLRDDREIESNELYFLQHLDRLFASGYMPTDQDILQARLRTIGIKNYIFEVAGVKYQVFDAGGARSERKKWIHMFENVHIILFTVALGDYDKDLFEDTSINRLDESRTLFDSIANSRWFSKSTIILVFTKMDVLAEKLTSGLISLKESFPTYAGDSKDINTAKQFFADMFNAVSERVDTLSINYINATDTDQVRTLMDLVKDVVEEQGYGSTSAMAKI